MIKGIFMYVLALIVLLAPAIILGWIGWSLLDWPGLLVGVFAGLLLFYVSIRKIAMQEAALEAQEGAASPEQEAITSPAEEAVKRD
jgi:hypothetical protein